MNTRQLARRCRIDQIAALDNLFLAASKARRGKSRRPDVEAWWMRREVKLLSLQKELLSGDYTPDNLLSSNRNNDNPENRNDNNGFRCVLVVESSRKAAV